MANRRVLESGVYCTRIPYHQSTPITRETLHLQEVVGPISSQAAVGSARTLLWTGSTLHNGSL